MRRFMILRMSKMKDDDYDEEAAYNDDLKGDSDDDSDIDNDDDEIMTDMTKILEFIMRMRVMMMMMITR